MQPSDKCYTLIKHFEECRLQAYKDAVGIWTIGYGNTYYENGMRVKQGDVITQAQADKLLPVIVNRFAISVDQMVKRHIQQHEFDALVCFAYNVGIGALEKSTLLRKVNQNASAIEIEAEFLKWNKAGGKVLAGLTRRRKVEATLYRQGVVSIQ